MVKHLGFLISSSGAAVCLCVALEDSLSSAAQQFFLLLDGEVTPAKLQLG